MGSIQKSEKKKQKTEPLDLLLALKGKQKIARHQQEDDKRLDLSRIVLLHFPNRSVSVNREIEFVIQKNGANGSVEAKLVSPIGFVRDINLRILDPDKLAVRFSVDEVGDHYVNIRFDGEHIPHSPFRLRVHDHDNVKGSGMFSYASMVKPIGRGLKLINLKGVNEFRIDAMSAGDDKLLVGIYGPYGYIDQLFIHHLGSHMYYIKYYAGEPGPYIISILWGGIDVPGSPYFITAVKE